ncbi:LamG domain-containing protein [Rufibacter latericius]|uniref:LamG domain-containing protein n=1 Tax=Rufibacter latericius TaxID=2487040 RepID=A0A3M9M9V2_9BACT|nr:LamG domain-containing protein [Rufibacter latericius]RNI21985.1 LamG domain-containing protein [Rufibacter latericius]
MKKPAFLLSCLVTVVLSSCASVKPVSWNLNNLALVGGHPTTVVGNPAQIQGKRGIQVLGFDGVDDGLLVDHNPLAGAEEFTIEVVFKPNAAWPVNVEQRFLHLEDMATGQRRILLELRLNNRNQWYPDFFLRTEKASLTLIDSTKTHPVGEWATMTLTYKDKQLKGYVNGKLELSGEIEYLPIPSTAKVSLGTRMDKRSWFNGEIESVRFWKTALQPKKYSDFL